MRRPLGSVLLALAAALVAAACGITEEGGLEAVSDAGVDGAGGGGGVGTSCFPGSKVCPDGSGQLRCVDANTPQTGCADSTGCTPCPLPHATAKCAASGECQVDACDPGWQDCNGNPVDGCETNVDGDHQNCGTCGTDCKATKGQNWICDAGTCIVNYCDPDTLLDCDKDKSNGCEVDSNTDVLNCKFCGNACSLAHAVNECVGQVCKIKSCDPGWENCDGVEANGCETNVATDPGNCGSCGKQCNSTNGTAGCSAGKCGIVCNAPFRNCDGNADNGCETNSNTNPSHCGACGSACNLPNANQDCSGGSCTIGSCKAGWASCDGKVNTGCETNLNTTVTACGSCSKTCTAPQNATPSCSGGNCGFACNQTYSLCGTASTCFATLTDPSHCGSTCQQCPGPASGQGSPVCNNGNCNVTCNNGFSKCGLDCFNLKTDKNHCGSCTNVCTAPQGGSTSCANSVCVPACPSALTLCNNFCADTTKDQNHCGGCGKKCTGGKVCAGSTCVCPGTSKDCGNGTCVACCGNSDCPGSDKCCSGVCKSAC
ncbi:MAG: hypothetical protein AMXMBFR56_39720 [Polyangiaceae bacterium]